MYYWRTVCNVMQKQRIDLCSRIQVINNNIRGYKHSSLLLPCISNKGYGNKFIFVGSNFEPVGKTNLFMNFYTTAGVRSPRPGLSQDREKIKNIIVFAGLTGVSVAVLVIDMVLTRTHHDHVYIKLTDEKK